MPPNNGITHIITIDFGEKHISIGITVEKMGISGTDIFQRGGVFHTIGVFTGVDDGCDDWIVYFALKCAKAEGGEGERIHTNA
jgi:hypothetical protein